MNESLDNSIRWRLRFPLLYMVVMTAIAAVWTAVVVARSKHVQLSSQHELLVKVAKRLDVSDPTNLVIVTLPNVAPGFQSWDVHVPSGPACELRFLAGDFSSSGALQGFESVVLSPGRHQIILHADDGYDGDYLFQCFVDGDLKLSKSMGADWLPNGWQQASGFNFHRQQSSQKQLAGRRYMGRIKSGAGRHFSGNFDQWSTEPGYRLWLARTDEPAVPASPFLGLVDEQYLHADSIGFVDGPRLYRGFRPNGYELKFSRPETRSSDPTLRVELEFFTDGDVVLSGQSPVLARWAISNLPNRIEPLKWQRDASIRSRVAYLHATGVPEGAPSPVVELRWDLDHPDEIGLRLADVEANRSLTRWRLSSANGLSHLWRIVESGEFALDSRKVKGSSDAKALVTLNDSDVGEHFVRWKTDVAEPLQSYGRSKAVAGRFGAVKLYRGLPVEFSLRLSDASNPEVWVNRTDVLPGAEDAGIPGGSVYSEVVVEVDAKDSSWVWLGIKVNN